MRSQRHFVWAPMVSLSSADWAGARGRYTVLLDAMSPADVPMYLFNEGQARWGEIHRSADYRQKPGRNTYLHM